jgi:hypothetical protein
MPKKNELPSSVVVYRGSVVPTLYEIKKILKLSSLKKNKGLAGIVVSILYRPKNSEKSFWIDTGFLVFNEQTYPNLIAFFKELQVPVAKSEMSFAVSIPRLNGKPLGGRVIISIRCLLKEKLPSVGNFGGW